MCMAKRKGSWRVRVYKQSNLRPRKSSWLRWMGEGRLRGVELQGCTTVLHQIRGHSNTGINELRYCFSYILSCFLCDWQILSCWLCCDINIVFTCIEVFCFDFLGYHGKGGPLPVKDGTSTPLAEIYRQAMKELGYPVTDCNGRTQTGKQVFLINSR